MAAPQTSKSLTPAAARKVAGKTAADTQTKFIDILKTDHKFDLIKKIVDHMSQIERAKKIRPQEKHRLLQNYYMTLLSYALPKMKVVEDNSDRNKTPINFQINVGGNEPAPKKTKPKKKKAGGVSITIPTVKNDNGSYSVNSNSDQTN